VLEVATTNLETDFWGPASNFGIPMAAIADMSKDPEMYFPPTFFLGLTNRSLTVYPAA
jgi:hypothetical protein